MGKYLLYFLGSLFVLSGIINIQNNIGITIVSIVIGFFLLRTARKRSAKISSQQKEIVKVYDVKEYKEIPYNTIYRFKNDKPNTIRFKRKIPEGFTRWQNIGLHGEKVTGTSYRQEICKKFINGENRRVAVEYAPTEEHPSAIEVLGIWTDKEGQHRERIGYIESGISQEIYNTYNNLPISAVLATIYKPTKNKSLGIRIFLLRKTRPSKYKREAKKTSSSDG